MDPVPIEPQSSFYLALGTFTAQWAYADYALDACVGVIFHKYNSTRWKKLPWNDHRVKFLREWAKNTHGKSSEELIDLLDKHENIQAKRHDLIHGVISSWSTEKIGVVLWRLRNEKQFHHQSTSKYSAEDVVALASEACDLAMLLIRWVRPLLEPLSNQGPSW